MPASSALSLPGPLQSIMIAAAVFAGCVAGAVIFLGWLDKQVPSLPVGPPPVKRYSRPDYGLVNVY